MGKILILSGSEERITQFKKSVENMGHSVIAVEFDKSAEFLHTKKPDLALIDLVVRGVVETWQQLKDDIEESHTPAIVIIPRDRIRDIELLKKISDFIIYPYEASELEMRIKLILVKYESTANVETIKIGNLAIDPTKYEVTVDGWSVTMTLKEYELLKYMATHRGRVFTREVLLDQIWGYNYYGGTRTVDVHIGRLRTKIESRDYSFIRTVRGVGYMFTDEY